MLGVAIAGLVLGGISLFTSWHSTSKSLEIQQAQLELQQQQLELQKQQYYDDLTSSYYSYMSQLAELEGEYESTQNAINQGIEDVASNRYYLDRWADEHSSTMQSALSETQAAWQEAASALGETEAVAGATGRSGSVNLIAKSQDQAIRSLTGGTLTYSLNGTLGTYLNSLGQDSLAERQTAASTVTTLQQSIASYRQTLTSLTDSMNSLTNTTEEIKNTLTEAGRTV